jgi:hypothetical protein
MMRGGKAKYVHFERVSVYASRWVEPRGRGISTHEIHGERRLRYPHGSSPRMLLFPAMPTSTFPKIPSAIAAVNQSEPALERY